MIKKVKKKREIFCRYLKSAYLCTRFRKGTLKGVRVCAARNLRGNEAIFEKTGTSNYYKAV